MREILYQRHYFDYSQFFSDSINDLKDQGLYRFFTPIERLVGEMPYAYWNKPDGSRKKIVVWCTNDYLGLSQNREIIKSLVETAEKMGAGAGGTRNIAGTWVLHNQLEEAIAKFHEKQKALVFSSGYVANEATLSTLGRCLPECVIFSDEKNHASMIQGIRHSGCEKYVFKHNDLNGLREKLRSVDVNRPKIIAFVSVYSMEGDFAPVEEICDLAEEYNALTYMDEVHAVGLYGDQGQGLGYQQGLHHRIDILQGNFAKAFGVVGGYVTGSDSMIDFVRSHASGFIFTTSLPPSTTAAALKSLEVIQKSSDLRQRLWENVRLLKDLFRRNHLPKLGGNSHIVPVVVGDSKTCKMISDFLLEEYGCYVQPINYPTVPKGTERLRITVTPYHTKEMIEYFTHAMTEAWVKFGLFKAA